MEQKTMNCIAPKNFSPTILTFSLAEISNKVFKQWKLYTHMKSMLLDQFIEFSDNTNPIHSSDNNKRKQFSHLQKHERA